ncbi:hypothetical protein PAECIP111890_01846 [Paenibacillus sp. JJ-223]|nr:hypothetical protein PAECIP111890_01846 [Paenibacillus sp. JJ-223]
MSICSLKASMHPASPDPIVANHHLIKQKIYNFSSANYRLNEPSSCKIEETDSNQSTELRRDDYENET